MGLVFTENMNFISSDPSGLLFYLCLHYFVKYLSSFLPNILFSSDHSDQSAFPFRLKQPSLQRLTQGTFLQMRYGLGWFLLALALHIPPWTNCPYGLSCWGPHSGLPLPVGYLVPSSSMPNVLLPGLSNPVNDLMLMGMMKRSQHLCELLWFSSRDCICILTVIRG